MIKKIYIFISIIIIFLVYNKLFLNNQPDIKIQDNIDFSSKKTLDLEVEVIKGFFKKTIGGLMFIDNNRYRVLLYDNNIKKIDIGCNEKYFWYWSEREAKNTLFYSENKDKDFVLKDEYNPSWMFGVFKNLEKKDQTINLIKNNKIISKAQILENNGIVYSLIEEGIKIKVIIKNVSNQNFDEDVFNIPFKEYYINNKMIPK